ncbi:hypothetical protein [Ancylobacter radicis]|uniref:Acyl-CoA carboxylase subunit epsilon n=1 Tax=Ancylobacter radicis TaxID=2836179 RepID=A0ABS5R4I9_9HYPH|nr:hypothetical protein [Ancylobacter radicis]MBS9476573.1 hypothetical protein [Ancylobacter radicis]
MQTSAPHPTPHTEPCEPEPIVITEADVSAILQECSGDSRAAIRALLLGQAVLQQQLEEARREASWGYLRGRPSRWINRPESQAT